MDDCRYPWFIIVPRVPNCREWFDLPSELSQQLFDYSQQLGAGIKQAFQCHKINIAALGNVVEQLHIHVIGRQIDDPAWPGPVWGHSPAIPYTEQQLSARLKHLKETTIVNNIL